MAYLVFDCTFVKRFALLVLTTFLQSYTPSRNRARKNLKNKNLNKGYLNRQFLQCFLQKKNTSHQYSWSLKCEKFLNNFLILPAPCFLIIICISGLLNYFCLNILYSKIGSASLLYYLFKYLHKITFQIIHTSVFKMSCSSFPEKGF